MSESYAKYIYDKNLRNNYIVKKKIIITLQSQKQIQKTNKHRVKKKQQIFIISLFLFSLLLLFESILLLVSPSQYVLSLYIAINQ